MDKTELIKDTSDKLQKLPVEKVQEVNHNIEILLSSVDDQILTDGIADLNATSKAYDFLNDEEDLYTLNDIIEKY